MDVNGARTAKDRSLVGHLICVFVCVCVRVHENEWGGGAVTKRIKSKVSDTMSDMCFLISN